MYKVLSFIIFSLLCEINVTAQVSNLKSKSKKFQTADKTIVEGEIGFLTVPENRSNAQSREIKIKFVRLKSLSKNPAVPTVYLEGGGSTCTWQAEDPKSLSDWLPILEVSDLIFIDQRGTSDRKLIEIRKNGYPEGFLVSAAQANSYIQDLGRQALKSYKKKGIDILGYEVVAHAKDIDELTRALGISNYSIFGFSFGTHIGMALMSLQKDRIENAVLVSTDGLNQSFNLPSLLDNHFEKISALAAEDSAISASIPDLSLLLKKVMKKLEENPARVTVKHPLTKKSMDVEVGPFGLALILRLDIDDANDIPAIPRLLYSIDKGDYSMLQWFVQKRIPFTLALPGNGINQGIASWASEERWSQIEEEASESIFGNVVNFPFYEASHIWPRSDLEIDTSHPISSDIRTLFVTGDLDCRTPVVQAERISQGFSNATHLIVKNAGHEQALWNVPVFDEAIPAFLKGETLDKVNISIRRIKFIPLNGANKRHPSIGSKH